MKVRDMLRTLANCDMDAEVDIHVYRDANDGVPLLTFHPVTMSGGRVEGRIDVYCLPRLDEIMT